jgi:hypothetical protein
MYPNATGEVCLESPATSRDEQKDKIIRGVILLQKMFGRNPIVVLSSQRLTTDKGGPQFIKCDQVQCEFTTL